MHILCLGLNHQTAEVSLREQLAFDQTGVKAALARLGCGYGAQPQAVSEMVILSTCNRVEIYALSSAPGFTALENFFAEVQGIDWALFVPYLYRYSNEQAVRHLFRVAAGLDSLVLGEPQILGQVMQAFELARSQSAVGPVLSRLFQRALHAGKRARSETAISQNPASISSLAARLAEKAVPKLETAQVLVLGAGEMAELAVEALRKRGVSRLMVVNRTAARAQSLAQRWQGRSGSFEMLPQALQQADILIASTGAPHILVHADLVALIMRQRPDRQLVIIDIAVPRDVDEQAGSLPGVHLYDIDSLSLQLEDSLAQRAAQVPLVEQILEQELKEYLAYLSALDIFPIISAMRQHAELIRQSELEKTLRRMPDLSEFERQRLEALTQALVKKLLHTPITRLRASAGTTQSVEYSSAARALFDLDGQNAAETNRSEYSGV
jgi:glutamyl-tRNA reductase